NPTAPHNLQYLHALQATATLAEAMGETELASRYHRLAHESLLAIDKHFRGPDGRLSDDLQHSRYSEHTPALAILAGIPNVTMPDSNEKNLAVATIYFSHYVFEAYRQTGEIDRLLGRLDLWRWHLDNGLHTTIDMPEPTRSDCHAW